MTGTLHLIPVPLGKNPVNNSLPPAVLDRIRSLEHFAVESLPNALRFLQWVGDTQPTYAISFYELTKHTKAPELLDMLQVLKKGHDLGVLSDAGCPGIADPGAKLADLAQRNGIRVQPWVGPNSMLLALMGSGLDGQSFAFSGYLPVDAKERNKAISQLELSSFQLQRTELFMEAPHRNATLFEALVKQLKPNTRLCVACQLTLEDEWLKTKTVEEWRKSASPDIHKKPCIFLLKA